MIYICKSIATYGIINDCKAQIASWILISFGWRCFVTSRQSKNSWKTFYLNIAYPLQRVVVSHHSSKTIWTFPLVTCAYILKSVFVGTSFVSLWHEDHYLPINWWDMVLSSRRYLDVQHLFYQNHRIDCFVDFVILQ